MVHLLQFRILTQQIGQTLRWNMCQQSRRARLALDFSTGWACLSHASDVLGMCVMITLALLRTETERWREEVTISRPAWSYRWALGRLGMTGTSIALVAAPLWCEEMPHHRTYVAVQKWIAL